MKSSMLDLSKVNYNEDFKVYFTYDDIKHLPEYPEGPLIELYKGDLFMAPSPSTKHQQISLNLSVAISILVEAKDLGSLFTAPIDVILSEKNVFVPDLVFIKTENSYMISEKNISGSPDFIIEILSSNKTNDLVKKKDIYQEFGIQEYWIVDPNEEMILKYVLENEKYKLSGKFDKSSKFIKVDTLNIEISMEKIFK